MSAIWLGDVVRAWSTLPPTAGAEERSEVARLLGFRPGLEAASAAARLGSEPVSERIPPPSVEPGSGSIPHEKTAPRPSPLSVHTQLPASGGLQLPQTGARPLELSDNYSAPTLDLEPLFRPEWHRALLFELFATLCDEAEVDFQAVFRRLSQAKTLTGLPRRRRWSSRRGAELLIDRCGSLVPFRRDQEFLVARSRLLLGDGRAAILQFRGCPSRGAGAGRRSTWEPYRFPRPARPVILVTDLGIGRPPLDPGPASEAEWLGFCDAAGAADCRMVALVPYSRNRWPARLAAHPALSILEWGRGTGTGLARRARRR